MFKQLKITFQHILLSGFKSIAYPIESVLANRTSQRVSLYLKG